MFVRRGQGGERGSSAAGGLIAAAYRHRMSRALDPQLHTHVVAANLARGDGRSLHGAASAVAVSGGARPPGTCTRRTCAPLVRDRLGLEWGAVHKGAAELAERAGGCVAGVLAARAQDRCWRSRARGGLGSVRTRGGAEAAARSRRGSASSTGSTRTPGARRSEPARGGARPRRELSRDLGSGLERGRERLAGDGVLEHGGRRWGSGARRRARRAGRV